MNTDTVPAELCSELDEALKLAYDTVLDKSVGEWADKFDRVIALTGQGSLTLTPALASDIRELLGVGLSFASENDARERLSAALQLDI